ncbi:MULTISPECIES: efflux RND transporter permease subunit [Gulbenkiania]|uniref:Multidrug efflux pump subunit AcrB n=2 Tax=Gulbenkiania TaxID=397456 RepID=A0A0K6GSX4_9NEIS|nr:MULTISPECIES: efflux RND transporter permease subunit [Gulbenkiania]TCW32363.1 HAE1 family hydrophobic/amphiphilic exporter-1 [Gulbenkiania mobilis]CUA81633.1 Multidrug efflux pump subunit AcrB [Gulbenkiania indica]
MWLTRISIHNPYFATVLMLALVVLGFFSWARLPVEEFPDIRFPVAVISTQYTGASPTVVESEVSRPIEEAVNTINGIKHIRSYSFEGSSVVIVEFELSVDPNVAVQDVRDRVGSVQGSFRREISTPTVSQFNPNDQPLLSITLSSPSVDERTLTTWVDNVLKKRLQTVGGVGEAQVIGGLQREIRIQMDPLRMEGLGLSVSEVADVVRNANRDYPAGTVESTQNELAVRVAGKLRTPEDFANLIVAEREGVPIRLAEVADVRDAEAERNSISLIDGRPAVGIDIRAARGSNVVQVADGVKRAIDSLKGQMPAGTQVVYTYDKSQDVRNSLSEVQSTLIEGAVLTVLIVFLFLGSWRSTVITGLTLPVALIGTLFAVQALGFTLNLMTLMALSLSIGLLIDDAIVVRENIVRHANMGRSHYHAALEGTQEIGLAVLATTLTIVAVFLPVGFMSGIIGKFFHQFGLTVTVAVLISLFVSFTLDPMLSSIWYDPHRHGDAHRGPLGRFLDWFERSLDRLGERYVGAIRWVLGHRKTTMLVALAITVGSFALVPLVGGEFLPREDKGSFQVSIKTAPGSSLDYTRAKSVELDGELRRAMPEVHRISISVGAGSFGAGKTEARLVVDVGSKDTRERGLFQLMAEARKAAQKVAGIEIQSIEELGKAGGGGKPVNLGLRGTDVAELERTARALTERLKKIPGVTDVESSLADADPALNVVLNREAASSLGVDLARVGDSLSILLAGNVVTTWEAPDGENYDVRMRVPREMRQSELLDVMTVAGKRSDSGEAYMVPLSAVTRMEETVTPRQINRVDMQREIALTANISGRDNTAVFADINTLTQGFDLPPGVTIAQEGERQDMQESLGYALQALAMGVIFIYMILAAQFRSFTLPVAIMMALPLAFVGVFVALLLWGSTLNMFSVIGIVMLMGLAAKNGILLVDFINQARREGMTREEAIVEAGRVRLRPILMTSLAMIFGMLPLALGTGEGSETRAPMAHAIIGGLVTSTLLTLLVVPVVYTYMDGLRQRLLRLFKVPPSPEEGGPQGTP